MGHRPALLPVVAGLKMARQSGQTRAAMAYSKVSILAVSVSVLSTIPVQA